MATQVDISWDPSSFTLVDEGVYKVAIFDAEKKSNSKGDFYKITERINGGDFDGEDLIEQFVGLYGNTMFRIHDILTALGEIDKYYTAGEGGKGGRWHAIPDPSDLEGKMLWAVVEHEEYHAQESKEDKTPKFNDDGTPVVRESARITSYANAAGPKPEFKSTIKPGKFPNRQEYLAKTGGSFGGGGSFSGGGGQPGTGDTPW